jgi:hypothetical protein
LTRLTSRTAHPPGTVPRAGVHKRVCRPPGTPDRSSAR